MLSLYHSWVKVLTAAQIGTSQTESSHSNANLKLKSPTAGSHMKVLIPRWDGGPGMGGLHDGHHAGEHALAGPGGL